MHQGLTSTPEPADKMASAVEGELRKKEGCVCGQGGGGGREQVYEHQYVDQHMCINSIPRKENESDLHSCHCLQQDYCSW